MRTNRTKRRPKPKTTRDAARRKRWTLNSDQERNENQPNEAKAEAEDDARCSAASAGRDPHPAGSERRRSDERADVSVTCVGDYTVLNSTALLHRRETAVNPQLSTRRVAHVVLAHLSTVYPEYICEECSCEVCSHNSKPFSR